MRKLLLMLLFLTMTGSAWALTDISVGAFGGLNAPIVQEDAKSGAGFGLKAKISPSPMLAGALFFEMRSFGDPELTTRDGTMSSDGGKVTAFGVEALIGNTGGGPGPHFFWTVGLGSYKWTRDGYEDVSKIGYHLGPGLEIVLPSKIGIEARANFEVVPTDGGGSRKNILIFVGANYHLGLL
jgi:hypothetical protein